MTTGHNSFAAYNLASRYLLSEVENTCPVVLQFKAPKQVGPFPQIPVPWKGSPMSLLRQYIKVPTRSEIVTTRPLDEPVLQLELSFIEEAKAAPLGWILDPEKPIRIVDHVIAYLLLQEAHESNLHIKADLRQAQICLILASRGNTDPFVASSYVMYGTHPDKVYPKMRANRMARLGEEYSQWFDAAGNLRPDVPKKPQQGSGMADAALPQSAAGKVIGGVRATAEALATIAGSSPAPATKKPCLTSSGQVSPSTATPSSEYAGRATAFEERGISPDSAPSPMKEAAERSTSERLAALIQIPKKEAV